MTTPPRFEHWFRLGYAARGVVWTAIGLAALASGRGQSPRSVIASAHRLPLGPTLLIALAVGLAGLACFRLVEAAFDLDRRGDHSAALLQRLGRGVGGLGYFALAAAALLMAWDGSQAMPAAGRAAREVRAHSGGGAVLMALALGTIGVAVAQGALAISARFRATLDPAVPTLLIWCGRLGYAARAVIFFLVGWYLLRAGLAGHRVRDAATALGGLRQHWLAFHLVAAGLLLFGLFSLAEARYRFIPDDAELLRHSRERIGRGG